MFNPGHIAERYGLFTIIVVGETILAVSVGLRDALDGVDGFGSALVIVATALVIAFGLRWIYFDALGRDAFTSNRKPIAFADRRAPLGGTNNVVVPDTRRIPVTVMAQYVEAPTRGET